LEKIHFISPKGLGPKLSSPPEAERGVRSTTSYRSGTTVASLIRNGPVRVDRELSPAGYDVQIQLAWVKRVL
jgi:hypothetical protein